MEEPLPGTPHPGLQVWLSDPGTFPLMLIVITASTLGSTFFIFNLCSNPDIRIEKDKRKSTLRYWGA